MVPWRAFVELANRGRVDIDRTNAAQRDRAGGRRTVRAMPGAAKKNGYRAVHPILRVPSARRSGSAGMVPSRGAATGEGADGFDRSANRSGHRARARAYSTAGLLRESFPDRHGNAAVLPPCSVAGEPADSRRTGELLRRRSNCGLRRRRELRASAYADGRMADGAGLDDGGQSQPARRAGDAATRMEWNRRKNSRGGASREFRLLGGSAAGSQRFPGRGARRVGQRRSGEAGARKQQRDCGYAGGCSVEGTRRASRETSARCPTRTETATEPGQRTADSERWQEAIVHGCDGGGRRQDYGRGRTHFPEDSGRNARIHQGDARSWIATQRGRTHRDESTGHHPEYVREMRKFDSNASIDDLIGMKVQGITPEYFREARKTYSNLSIEELIGMKVQGITPEYVRSTQAAGFKDLDCDELIGAKVQGVTPEFIEKARKHGFQNLTLDKLIALKHADIL